MARRRKDANFPALVASKQCATCIFTSRSPISPEALAARLDGLKGGDGHQVCHKYGVEGDDREDDGEDVWCRGFWNRLPDWQKQMFVDAGFVRFVDENDVKPI